MTSAIDLSALAADGRDRPTAKIIQRDDVSQNGGSLLFESGKGIQHFLDTSIPNVSLRKEYTRKKRTSPDPTSMSRTHWTCVAAFSNPRMIMKTIFNSNAE